MRRSTLPSDARLRQRPLSLALQRSGLDSSAQSGFGLLGIIIGLALSAAVVGVAYTAYTTDHREGEVATSTRNLADLQQSVMGSYMSAADYTGLSTQSAVQTGAVPKGLLKAGVPTNLWGGAIDITAVNVAGASGPGNNNGYALTFEQVPANECMSFALNGSKGFYDVKVNNSSVMTGRQVSVTAASSLCNQGTTDTVQFIQAKASPNGATQPDLTPCVPPAPSAQNVACPAGQLSSVAPYSVDGISQTNQGFCNSAYGVPGITPWQTVGNTCVPSCASTLPAPTTQSQNQSTACPAGQVTIASGAASFTQTQTRSVTYSCPALVGPYSTAYGAWSAWSPVVGSVCAPQCIAPTATTGSQNITGTCPGGQVTASGATTFTQTQTRNVTYACPAPTGGYTTAYGAWSAATPAVGSVCAPKCVAPAPSSYQNQQWPTANPGCPAGQTGTYTYQYQQVQTVTTTYSCPAPQGSYTSNTSVGGWSNTGATTNVANNCVAAAPTCSAVISGVTVDLDEGTDFNGREQFSYETWTSVGDCEAEYSASVCTAFFTDLVHAITDHQGAIVNANPLNVNFNVNQAYPNSSLYAAEAYYTSANDSTGGPSDVLYGWWTPPGGPAAGASRHIWLDYTAGTASSNAATCGLGL